MISVAEALAKVVEGVSRVSTEQVPLPAALGRVLAEDVSSRVSHPPVAVSAMDGYAVRAEDVGDTPTTLKQVGISAAGSGFDGAVGPGETVRIFTGAPLPVGADSIVIQEDTEASGDTITITEPAPPGHFVRPAGLDFKKGDALLSSGTVLTARDIGLAFQIADDLLDVEGDEAKAGKALRKDEEQGKQTFVTLMGVEQARAQATMLVEQAGRHLSSYGEDARLLVELADFGVKRDH